MSHVNSVDNNRTGRWLHNSEKSDGQRRLPSTSPPNNTDLENINACCRGMLQNNQILRKTAKQPNLTEDGKTTESYGRRQNNRILWKTAKQPNLTEDGKTIESYERRQNNRILRKTAKQSNLTEDGKTTESYGRRQNNRILRKTAKQPNPTEDGKTTESYGRRQNHRNPRKTDSTRTLNILYIVLQCKLFECQRHFCKA